MPPRLGGTRVIHRTPSNVVVAEVALGSKVMTASGTLDFAASKIAVKSLVAEPSFDERCEVLLDFRDIECAMSVVDIFQLAEHIGFPNPALPTKKKIAVLVTGHRAFDHAQFLELCASNRGLKMGAFEDYENADAWLNADLPHAKKKQGLIEVTSFLMVDWVLRYAEAFCKSTGLVP